MNGFSPAAQALAKHWERTNPVSVMAVLETPNYTFYAFGISKEEALKDMQARWEEHAEACELGGYRFVWEWAEMVNDVWFTKIQAGAFERSELPELNEGN